MKKLLFVIALMMSVPAQAEFRVGKYQSVERPLPDEVVKYVQGIGTGLVWMETYVDAEHKIKIWCDSSNVSLNAKNYIDILDKEINIRQKIFGKKAVQEEPVALILLFGLQRTFPCIKK